MPAPRSILATLLAGALAVTTAVATGASSATGRAGTIWRVSTASDGTQGNGDARFTSTGLSSDGRYVVFASTASNLVPGDTDGEPDVFRHDRLTGRTQLVSVGLRGGIGHYVPPLCLDGAWNATISANGRFVAFESCYDNLVAGDTNASEDIFVRDMLTGVTIRASVGAKDAQANGFSDHPMISADGRSVVFSSAATNLDPRSCPSDTESQVFCSSPAGAVLRAADWVFVRDLVAHRTTLVSVTADGKLPDGSSDFGSLSATGRFVAYNSTSDNLTPNDTNNQCTAELGGRAPSCGDVFLYDRLTRHTELISVGLNGESANGDSAAPGSMPIISTDGRYVAFQSGATNIVPNTHDYAVYVRDRARQRTTRVSVFSDGREMVMGDGMFTLTPDGRFVVMDDAEPLSCSLPPNVITRYDLHDSSVEIEDRTDAAGRDLGCTYVLSANPAVTPNGRYVAFVSNATAIVPGDTNEKADVFVRDRGLATGLGGLAGGKAIVVSGNRAFGRTGVLAAADATGDAAFDAALPGADLIGAQLRYRPQLHDLFVRLEVSRMPLFELASPSVVYALDFTARGHRYEIRVAKTGPTTASFGLFDRTPAGWALVANVSGGYGTTGQEIVAAVPIAAIPTDAGAPSGRAVLSDVTATTGLGSFATGVTAVSDAIRLG
jgi:Tol biopolymer transport system component